MVGVTSESGGVESLLGRDGPVVVKLVLDIQLNGVVGFSLKRGRHVGLVRELILDTSKDGEWLAHKHLCTCFVAVD